MRERIDQLVAAFEASLDDGSATPESFQQAVADLKALEPITELDRLYYLAGTVRLLDTVLTRLRPDEGLPVRDQRAGKAGDEDPIVSLLPHPINHASQWARRPRSRR